MDDRRKHRRYAVTLAARLTRSDLTAGPIPVNVADVSSNGVKIAMKEEIQVGTPVALSWSKPPFAAGGEVVCNGTVVSARRNPLSPGGGFIGVAFSDVEPALIQKLVQWAQMQRMIGAKVRARPDSRFRTDPYGRP